MSDPLQHVAPGDPLIFRADTFNLLLDAAQFTRRRQRGPVGTPKGNAIFPPLVPATLAYGKNTGSTIVSHSAVSPTGVTPISPIDNPLNARAQPVFVVAPSTADDEVVFITQEPIQGGSNSPLGRIATSGVTVAYIDVSDADHEFARVDAEGNLVSATSGPLRILGPFETGAGGRLVLIGGSGGSSAPGAAGTCFLGAARTNDCILATASTGDAVTLLQTSGTTWTSVTDLDYPGGSGPVVMAFANGQRTLSLDGLYLENCGNGCYTGSIYTGHVDEGETYTSGCDGETFTVCLSCGCNIEPVSLACCDPIPTLPSTMWVAFADDAAHSVTLPLFINPDLLPSVLNWVSPIQTAPAWLVTSGSCPFYRIIFSIACDGTNIISSVQLLFYATDDLDTYSSTGNVFLSFAVVVGEDCLFTSDPFELDDSGTLGSIAGSCGTLSLNYTVAVTETVP